MAPWQRLPVQLNFRELDFAARLLKKVPRRRMLGSGDLLAEGCVSVSTGDDGIVSFIQASKHVRAAINILDRAGAPADIAAHLDLAVERLGQLTGSRWSDGFDEDPNPAAVG